MELNAWQPMWAPGTPGLGATRLVTVTSYQRLPSGPLTIVRVRVVDVDPGQAEWARVNGAAVLHPGDEFVAFAGALRPYGTSPIDDGWDGRWD